MSTDQTLSLPAESFTWEGNSGAADASDLEHHGLRSTPSEIALKSPRTGVTKVFSFAGTRFSVDHEIIGWEFRSHDGFSLMIFND